MQPQECKPQAGRPKDQAKRAAILEAARQHFLQNGFDRASMDAIAASACVSKLTVYSHFGNKDALFKELIMSECCKHELSEAFASLVALTPREALTSIAAQFAAKIFRQDAIDMYRVILAESVEKPKISELFYEAGPQQVKACFADYLKLLDEAGKLRVDDPQRATHHFFSMLKGEYHFRCLLNLECPTSHDMQAHIDDVVGVFLRAYSPINP